MRKLIEASGLDATYVYFGNLVHGPGKVFAEQFVEWLDTYLLYPLSGSHAKSHLRI